MKMLRNSTASVTEDAFTMPHGDTSKIGHAAPHDSLLDRLTRSSGTRELRDEDWASCDDSPARATRVCLYYHSPYLEPFEDRKEPSLSIR